MRRNALLGCRRAKCTNVRLTYSPAKLNEYGRQSSDDPRGSAELLASLVCSNLLNRPGIHSMRRLLQQPRRRLVDGARW